MGTREKLKCTWNFTIMPEMHLKDICEDDFDALAIPGGFEEAGFYEDAFREDVLDLIRRFNEKGKIIAFICVGALAIGKSGVLKGRNATTYNLSNQKRQKQLADFGVNDISDQPIVINSK